MCNWAIQAAAKLAPLITLMHKRILAGPLVQLDETPLQVMNEPGRANTAKSWMWLARGGPPEHPLVLYTYRTSRNSAFPLEFLASYCGYVQTDGWEGYDRAFQALPKVVHVGCWAHVRRKFFEASKGGNRFGGAGEGLAYIRKLYAIESELRERKLPPEEFLLRRKEQTQPILEEFHRWLEQRHESLLPQSLLGKAVGYSLRQWHKLVRYREDPILRPDNNAAENAIRPFVLGRKNWLFSGSPAGADASCAIYSVIETAKVNGLDPYRYLAHLFETIPVLRSEAAYEVLMPERFTAEQTINTLHSEVR